MKSIGSPPLVLELAVLAGFLASGCAAQAPATVDRPTYLAQSMATDCKPGESSVVCCIKKWGPESCGVSASEAADLLNGARVLHEATKDSELKEEEGTPEWKQRCIDLYVTCQDDAWLGSCYSCFRFCEGQRSWPQDKCRPRKRGE